MTHSMLVATFAVLHFVAPGAAKLKLKPDLGLTVCGKLKKKEEANVRNAFLIRF